MKAAKFLFFARTSRTSLFKNKENIRMKKFVESGLLSPLEISELEKHNKIVIAKK